jgi:hypothetical protein
MTRAEKIVQKLTDGSDMAAAAVLVAMDTDRDFAPGDDGEELTYQLEEIGCLDHGHLTMLGRDVAKELRRKGILAGTED